MSNDYRVELEKWMSERYLTTFDVTDLIEEIRKDRKQTEPDESMDGDFDSAMASAGHGTDEDYGGGCYQMEDFGWAGDENLCGE